MRPLLAAPVVFCFGLATLAAQPSDAARAREMVAQVNWARQHPQAAAEALRGWLKAFEGDRYLCFPGEPRLRLEEGRAAVVEAIAFLDRQPPVPPVAWSDRLARAARILAADQARLGGLGHQGSDGSLPSDRVAEDGPPAAALGEVATYGTFGEPGDPRRAVLALIVDDGVRDRGHRKVIFDPQYRLAGAAWGPHPLYTRMAVVDFASAFLPAAPPR